MKRATVGQDLVIPNLLQIGCELFQRGQVGLGYEDGFCHTNLLAVSYIPRHSYANAILDAVGGRKTQQELRLANVGLTVAHIARPKVAVAGLCGGGHAIALQRVAQRCKELVERGAVAHGHVVDLVFGLV